MGQGWWRFWTRGAAAGGLVLAMASPASAQATVPRWELFGGYSFLAATGSDFPRGASSGVEGEVALNVNRWLALAFSASAQFDTSHDLGFNFPGVEASSSVAEYLGAVRFTARGDRTSVFAQALVGLASGKSSLGGFSDSGFALGGGGGVDVRINHRLAFRGHVEVVAGFVDLMETDVRFGAGLVVRLGR